MTNDTQDLTEQDRIEVDVAAQESKEARDQADHFISLPSRWDRFEALAEVIATVVLAVATLSTAWSGYQSSRWGGVQSTKFSEAGTLRIESNRASTLAVQLAHIDVGLFTNWVNASAVENQKLADYYADLFSPELKVAFEAWLVTDPLDNPDAPQTPFSMPEYSPKYADEADQLEEEAAKTFAEGIAANLTSDEYVLNTVILASVLFLAGLQSRINSVPARMVIIILGLLILAYGLFTIITSPIN